MRQRARGALVVAALLAGIPQGAAAAVGTLCGILGDRVLGRTDTDTFTLRGAAGEHLRIELAPGASVAAVQARLRLTGGRRAQGALPLVVETRLRAAGPLGIAVRQLRRERTPGAYCLTVTSSGTAAESLADGGD